MTHAWFDLTAGVAGDMLLGALLDVGAGLDGVQRAIDAVVPGQVRLTAEEVVRGGQRATKARVVVSGGEAHDRRWVSLRGELQEAPLHPLTRQRALDAFGRLADAEARVHGTSADEVHFHEVGALDSIADVVGTCEALRQLGVTSVSASGIALGAGRVRAAHGDLPVPVPAVAELIRGWRTVALATDLPGASSAHEHDAHEHGTHEHGVHENAEHDRPAVVTTPGEVGELATPTGVALVRALAVACESLPALSVMAVGVGAGGRDFPGRPNVVRVVLGELTDAEASERPVMVEQLANVDDLDPRLWPGVLRACLDAGAADAWLTPILMKKGRPAHTVHALVEPRVAEAVADVILTHTTTLGVRELITRRHVLDRSFVTLALDEHPLSVKVGSRGGLVVHAAAEFESVAAVAAATGRSEAEVAQLAMAAIVAAGLVPGAPAARD